MPSAAALSFDPATDEVRRFQRIVLWSFAIHLTVVLGVAFAPRSWFTHTPPPSHLMTISLGGTVGPRTTGTTSIGGRAVEQVAPPPKRPTPVRPTPEDQAPAAAPVKTPPASKPAPAAKPATPTTRPPVTGPEVTAGNTKADTGVTGLGAGLTMGGGGGGGETDLSNFCCPDYLRTMTGLITNNWHKDQPQSGTTTLRFIVQRNGAITDISVERSSGSGLLDRAAKDALEETQLPPLPPQYTGNTLIIHLMFPFNGTN